MNPTRNLIHRFAARPCRACAVLLGVALLSACGTAPRSSAPMSTNGTLPPFQSGAPAIQADYGRVTAIDPLRTQEQGQGTGAGAIIGGVAGAVVGNQVGSGSGRDAARIAGAVGGAVAGNAVERNARSQWRESYRIMVQLENGINRAYEVPSPGDLRVGDRVRIENNQIFRM
jgi:outer membrane lipoprotein SlyB